MGSLKRWVIEESREPFWLILLYLAVIFGGCGILGLGFGFLLGAKT